MDQATIVILGVMGPLLLIGTIGLIYMFYIEKKEKKRRAPREGGMRLLR